MPNIKQKYLDRLEISKEMLDRVMNYLEKNHYEVYDFIIQKEIETINKDVAKLKDEVYSRGKCKQAN